jgi:hypothetical protein
MAITFSVASKIFKEYNPDGLALAVKTWLDSLNITTVHEISISLTVHGYWEAIVIYEA